MESNIMEKIEGSKDKKTKDEQKKEYALKMKDTRMVSGLVDESKQIIVEQIWDPIIKSRFAIWDDKTKTFTCAKEYFMNGLRYIPNEGEEIEKKFVLLPEIPQWYDSDIKLDEQIVKFIKKWLDVPTNIIQLGKWNTMKSYVYDKFNTVNYLRARGDLGTGKSRFIDVFGFISYKPLFTTGAITPAPLFRMIDKWKSTLCMDEADLNQSDAANDVIKVLNQGFERGKFILRCDPDDANKVLTFDPFCPKIIGTRLSFVDKATESRCITHITSATQRKDIPMEKDASFYKEALDIRNKLLMWRFRNYFSIKTKVDVSIDLDMLEPRIKQLVSSFACIFSENKEEMKIFQDWIVEYQKELIDERQDSLAGEIIGAMHKMVEEGAKFITSSDIVNEAKMKDLRGNPLAPQKLASTLKSLGLHHIKWYICGEQKRIIVLEKELLNSLFKRYGYTETDRVFDKYVVESKTTKTTKTTWEGGLPPTSENERNTKLIEGTL
jgi:hypothetical protein